MDSDTSLVVSVGWVMERLGHMPNLRIVDARAVDAYRAAHIPGSGHSDQNQLRIPDSSAESVAHFHKIAEAAVRRLGIRRGDRVVFYEDFSGASAAHGVWMLDYMGIGGGAILDGGLNAWVEAGGALTRELPASDTSEVEIAPNAALLATAEEILAGISAGDDSLRILDTRSPLENRTATIPTATHLDWIHHLDREGRFRPTSELAELYRSIGLEPDTSDSIVTFCGSGYRAAHTYLVLKALGFQSVKNYVPSWGEWGRRADLPVERPHEH